MRNPLRDNLPLLFYNPGIEMHGHSHSNSIIPDSLYYCELPAPASSMVFTRHISDQQIDLDPPDLNRRNIYNTPIDRVIPKQDDVFLFSSRLTHMIEKNVSDRRRHSIAFSTFVRGKLGDYRAVIELKL